jgi:hypothetical protein
VGTFFLIGDDSVIQNNEHPFQGVDYSLGAQYTMGSIESALEWHHAIGSTMGTVRLRAGYAF